MQKPSHHSGVLAAGNFIVDQVKTIDHWPDQDSLASILSFERGNGGGPYNLLKDLSRAGVSYPLAAAGLIGKDPPGQYILDDLGRSGIDSSRILTTDEAPTSYTDVMTDKNSGRRTFFHMRGSNALLDIDHFDFADSSFRIFYLGYMLLLDKLDTVEDDGRSRFGRVLRRAKEAGMTTVADAVSALHPRLEKVVASATRDVDALVLNEWEAGKATRRTLLAGDSLDWAQIRRAADDLLSAGDARAIIIHFPRGAYAKERNGNETIQGCVNLPQSEIKGTVGAGDAFCAGVIHGIHEGYAMSRTLKTAVSLAASCLRDVTTSNGIERFDRCFERAEKYGFAQL